MTQRQYDSHACKDWQLLTLHDEAMRIQRCSAILVQLISRWHGPNVSVRAQREAQEILKGVVK